MSMEYPSFDDVMNARRIFEQLHKTYWYQEVLFSWRWWLLLFIAVVPWIIWWKYVDKKRIFEIFSYGLTLVIVAILFDMIGVNHIAWAYPYRLYWAFVPPLLPYDITSIGVAFMLIYQKYRSWKAFMIASLLLSALYAFGAEQFLEIIGVYKVYTWKHVYSFLIYFVISLAPKWLIEWFQKVQSKKMI